MRLAYLLLCLLLAAPLLGAAPVKRDASRDDRSIDPAGWDATKARGKTRTIDFTTSEGTWMSVDISPDGRSIVFDLLGHIYLVPHTGGEARSLTHDSGVALNYHPAFSPDGRKIVFVSDRQGQDALWVMDADGGNARSLLFDVNSRFAEPQWMPDGRSVVATRRLNTHYGIYRPNDTLWIIPLDGSAARRLTPEDPPITQPDSELTGMPRWQAPSPSRDGRYVYFNSATFMGANRQIMRADLQLGRIQSVTPSKAGYGNSGRQALPLLLGETAPKASPNGRYLAFVRKLPGAKLQFGKHRLSGRTALWLRDLESGAERVLMDPVEYDQMLDLPMWKARAFPGYAWASDGRSIVLSQGGKLRRVDVATGEVSTIPFVARVRRVISEQARARGGTISSPAFAPHYLRNVAMSPDGELLAVEAAGRLWLKRMNGGSLRPLVRAADPEVMEAMPSWSPNSDRVAFVTSDGYGEGHLWVTQADGQEPHKISKGLPGDYLYPFWDKDGRTIYASVLPRGLQRDGKDTWELWRFDARLGGPGERVAMTGDPVDSGFRSDGRIYFTRRISEQGATPPRAELMSVSQSGDDVRQHLRVLGNALRIVPSKDLRNAAIQQLEEVWVAPLSSKTEVDVLAAGQGVRRISVRGGTDPFWIDDERLVFGSAGDLVFATADGRERELRQLGLQLPRAVAMGKMALKDARLVTLGPAGTIARGDVVVENGYISCVGRCDTSGVSQIYDVQGATIVPGFIDVHSHSTDGDAHIIPLRRSESAIYLAHGVTTIHDPSSTPSPSFVLQDLVESGRVLGPRTFSTGYIHLSRGRGFEYLRPIEGLQDARNDAERMAAHGVRSLKDFKIGTRIQRQMYAQAARERGLTVTSEGSEFPYTLGQIMDGVAGWEHPMQFVPMYGDLIRFLGAAGAHYSNQFQNVGYPNGTSIEYFQADAQVWNDSKLRNWMPWQNLATRRIFGRKPIDEYAFPILAENVGELMRAGGYAPLGGHGEMHGLGMHWEVAALAMGAGAEAALRAATLDGAHFLGLEASIGSIESGKLADLVVLDGNPLEDIRNTQKIRWVVKAGVVREGQTLDQIWPARIPYGRKPWLEPQIYREDVRRTDFWNDSSGGGAKPN